MSSPNPAVRKAQASGSIMDVLRVLEHAQSEFLHTELQVEGDELGRLIEQLKALRERLTGRS